MNTKLKLARLVVAATFGSLLWAGCASPRTTNYVDATAERTPVDLTQRRSDTYPAARTGLDHYTGRDSVIEVPVVIDEAAGTERRR